ncbi:hypothetical protein P171DRAFT_485089 [Karstenula rhodostoma CBS 690.94]|uniref:Uncharacterized protein n=1 Tax=Karstenula rhodostoma CBS 690.94 TaxID=1392251 RepID=A0A9P4PKL0_9PLEO|nr:hypothetical protein P171DRAFT_485089 [Karstenula rhodostoma CBS 690.94]
MSEQPGKTLKFGTPEYKAFMAKRKPEREAAVVNALAAEHPPSASGDTPAASTPGIASSIFALVPPATFQSTPAPAPAPAPSIEYANGEKVQYDDWTPQSPELCGWSDEDIARVRDVESKSPLAAAATFGIYRSGQPAFGFPSTGNGPYYRVNRIFPSIDGIYRSSNGEEYRRPSWGSASKPSRKVIPWRKDLEPANAMTPDTQRTVPAAFPNSPQRPVPIPPGQHEQSVECSRGRQATQSQPPRSKDSPVLYPVYHDPVHLRYTESYIAVNDKELRDELIIRGLAIPKPKKWKDLVDALTADDHEWSKQLLALECEVLSKLWVKEKVEDFMMDDLLQSRRCLEYGQLTVLLTDHYRRTPVADELWAKARPEEQHKMLLRIANQDGVAMRPAIPDDHRDIARKIADFRARKVAAEAPDRPKRCKPHERPLFRPNNHTLKDSSPLPQGTKRQREESLEEEVEDEAESSYKKARCDGPPAPIEKTSTTAKSGPSAGSTPELSAPSELAEKAAADVTSVHPPVTRGEKRQRGTDDEEEPKLEHKKARRAVAPVIKASKKGEATKTTTEKSSSSTKDVERGPKPESKGSKRQRDEEDDETKPVKKKSRQQHQDSFASEDDKKAAGSGTRQRKTRDSRKAGGTDEKEPKPKWVVIEYEDDEFSDFIDDGSEDEAATAKKKRRTDDEKFNRARFRRAANLVKD